MSITDPVLLDTLDDKRVSFMSRLVARVITDPKNTIEMSKNRDPSSVHGTEILRT